MRRFGYDDINDKSATTPTPSYDNNSYMTVKIVNAPNKIPSLQLTPEINRNKSYLTVGDIINLVVNRYKSLGLNNDFPPTSITILIDGTPYDHTSKNTQVPHDNKHSTISIKFPMVIDNKYLLKREEPTENTTLNGKPKSSWWSWG